MKKEKKVRTYQRRTKSGKTVTVRAHTASYEAAEKAKEAAKKKGAGEELSSKAKKGEEWKLPMDEFLKKLKDERAQKREDEEPMKVEDEKPKKKSKKKTEKNSLSENTIKKRTVGTGTNGPELKRKTTTKKMVAKTDDSEPAFTRDEFKEWYRGTGSAADKKVAKALRKQLGRSGYNKFEDEAINNYTSRGHLSMFKRVSGGSSTSAKTKTTDAKVTKDKVSTPKKRSVGTGTNGPELKKTSSAKVENGRSKVDSYAGKHGLTYEEDGVYSDRKGRNFVLGVKGDKVTKRRVNDHLTADSELKISRSKNNAKKTKSPDLSIHEGQMSYIRSRVKELPEESRKRLSTFLRKASTGAISTTDLWRKYQKEKYPKNKKQWSMPVPWDKRAMSDMAHSD